MGSTRLSEVQEAIAAAAAETGRSDPIRLVVATKYASDEQIDAVLADGATDLGESRAQSLVERAPRFPAPHWHFIGSLQRNKASRVRAVVDLLHSMDRVRLASTWAAAEGTIPPVLIQVDLAGEAQKGGVASGDAHALVEECVRLGVEVRGLMTVPPRPEVPGDSRKWFAELRELRDRIRAEHPGVSELSMGMSDDYLDAVGEGATILRVGRAIFEPFPHGS